MAEIKHDVRLEYYTSDDGIWLHCACGWTHNLGWTPSPAAAVDAEREHLAPPLEGWRDLPVDERMAEERRIDVLVNGEESAATRDQARADRTKLQPHE